MSDRENIEFINANIEQTYQQVAKVIGVKNELASSIAEDAEKLAANEHTVEEQQRVLQQIRSQITSNPILPKINEICEADLNNLMNLIEGTYKELQNLSENLDLAEANRSLIKQEYTQDRKLFTDIMKYFCDEVKRYEHMKNDSLKSINISSSNGERELLIEKNKELKHAVEDKAKCVITERNHLSLLQSQLAEANNSLQRELEVGIQKEKALFDICACKIQLEESLKADIISFTESEEILKEEAAGLVEKSTKLNKRVQELQEILVSQTQPTTELCKKKILHNLLKVQITLNENGLKELDTITTNIQEHDILLSNIQMDIKHWEDEKNKCLMDLKLQEVLRDDFLQQKLDLVEKNNLLEKEIEEKNRKLEELLKKNQNDNITLNAYKIQEESLLNEKAHRQDVIANGAISVNELKEKITQLEIEYEEKLLISPEIKEIEKENNELYIKIDKYMRAIEPLKKRRAMLRQKNPPKRFQPLYRENTDSSQDSMLVSK